MAGSSRVSVSAVWYVSQVDFPDLGADQQSALAPTYNSEIAQPSARGRMLATFQFFIGIGAFIAGWISYGVAKSQPGTAMQWRLPVSACVQGFRQRLTVSSLSRCFLLFLWFSSRFSFPSRLGKLQSGGRCGTELTDRWLMIKGREEEALHNLAKLHARGDINDPFVRGEFEEMRRKVHEEAANEAGWGAVHPSHP